MTSVTRAVLVSATMLVTLPLAAAAETPLDHLNEAGRILSAIPRESLKKDAQKNIDELRRHFAGLVDAYQTNGDSLVPPAAAPETDEKPADGGPVNWKANFSRVEKDVAAMLAGPSSLPSPDVQRQLELFRLAVELFFASAILDFESESRSAS
jgi:hypothetical protein